MEVSERAAIGPRFDVTALPASPDAPFAFQLRRALRSLLGQRGGTMLLHSRGSGATVRITCETSGASASASIACAEPADADAVRRCADALLAECARCGCALARIECVGPSRALLPAA
jgi:hypothetical protein